SPGVDQRHGLPGEGRHSFRHVLYSGSGPVRHRRRDGRLAEVCAYDLRRRVEPLLFYPRPQVLPATQGDIATHRDLIARVTRPGGASRRFCKGAHSPVCPKATRLPSFADSKPSVAPNSAECPPTGPDPPWRRPAPILRGAASTNPQDGAAPCG